MTSPADQPAVETPRIGRELVILPPRAPRDLRHNLRNLGIAAGCLLVAGGLGWGAGAYVGAAPPPAPKVAALQKADVAQLVGQSEATQRQETRQLADEVRALKASLDRGRPAEDVKALKASVEALRQGLDAAKTDTSGALAQLSGKLDRLERKVDLKPDPKPDLKPDPMPVGSIVPVPPVRPPSAQPLPAGAQPPVKLAEVSAPQKTQLPGWVLRDVYDGIALVEGRDGYREVSVGQAIPGAGKVEAIERRGRRWVLVTSLGVINSDMN
ncbi:hypothetical protein SAMN05444161_2802 [Rhizobiales bacterium GAS191]|jgi:hypothetical protein|nr:hypothetical protein SAMN05519103_02004 [Rhizobiales bacterium GAS113]SED22715.1 hypothetical protein SAMN05444161_2802 [Rhizobiales bacterium GAS191]